MTCCACSNMAASLPRPITCFSATMSTEANNPWRQSAYSLPTKSNIQKTSLSSAVIMNAPALTASMGFTTNVRLSAALGIELMSAGKRRYNIKLWKTFTDCFNCLPIAAIIDEKIFTMHGGLSPDLQSMEQIRRVMRPTDVPDTGGVLRLVECSG